ncbi:hypothetical protein LguiA_002721 [Lonicera macranthoides]
MADTIASPLLFCLCDRMNSLADSSWFRIWEKNRSNLMEMQILVFSAEKVSERGMELKKWMKDVSDVAYEADDLLDEFELFVSIPGNELEMKVINSISRAPSLFCSPVVSSILSNPTTTLIHKLRRIDASLDELANKYRSLNLPPINLKEEEEEEEEETAGSVTQHPLHTVPSINRKDVVGRNEEEETIVNWLLLNSYREEFSVVEIVGMGGIGKTTLAQLVYNNDAVRKSFDFMAWVWVSEEFDFVRIAKEIIEAAGTKGSYVGDISELALLGDKLIQVLRYKRFLIVLDDVWAGIDDKYWSILMSWFTVGSPGSKVMLTTRTSKVAAFTGGPSGTCSYFLGHLSDEDCWTLLHRSASLERYEDEEGKDKLFEIGEGVIAKCKGLPLAVKTLANLMSLKRTVQECLSMMETDIWQLPEFEGSVLPILGPSYTHLPPYLKPCFALCSVFPKGYSINKEKLIQYWISNRLIGKPRKGGSRTLEKIGSDYFEELVERSFFVEVSRDEFSDMSTTCQMPDFIHELAQSVAGSWCSVLETGSLQPDIADELHHSSLICVPGEPLFLQPLHQAKNLRTLLFFSSAKLDKIPTGFFQGFRCMRVLDLSQTGLCELPVSVGHLIHLRYLDLSYTYIKLLPRFIAKLKYLQTLQLAGCIHLKKLPKAISKLTSLRNLDIRSCCLLSQMPFGIGKLRRLQTLPRFLLSEANGCGNLNDLGDLSLRGRLQIENLEHVRNPAEVDDAKLYEKLNLSSLGLSWGPDSPERGMCDLVLEKLRPSRNLKVLDIIGYRGSFFPSWLCATEMMLVKLSLIDCYCDELPPLGRLPKLSYLHVKGLFRVRSIGSELHGNGFGPFAWSFESLKHLELYDMPNLVKWEITEADVPFPCLEVLSIKGCPKLAELPSLPGLRKLALSNCNLLLLQSLAHLTPLSSLVINDIRDHNFLSLKLESLKSITALTIYNCNSLICVLENVTRELSSLKNLRILYCKELKSLEVIECQDLGEGDMENIKSCLFGLRELTIEGCPNLVSLPKDSIQSLIDSHQKVVIKGCPKLDRELDVEASD